MDALCNKCGICCRLIPVKRGDGILVRDGFQIIDEEFFENLVPMTKDSARKINNEYVEKILSSFPHVKFYSCKKYDEEKGCLSNEKTPVCKKFPSTPLALVPDECSYMGEIFMKHEELKSKIRMIKEEILDYETLISMGDKDSASYKKIIENLGRFIAKYKDFGAENW